MGACEDQGSVTDFSGDRGAAFCVRCLGVLFLLTPLLSAQNPDELLAVRLPATQGYISRHPTPLPFPPGRGQTATPSRASKRGSSMASRPSGMARAADNRPGTRKLRPMAEERSPDISSRIKTLLRISESRSSRTLGRLLPVCPFSVQSADVGISSREVTTYQ